MTKYVLTDWEANGYDDSDFYATYWDDVEKKVVGYMHGTTRYGSCRCMVPAVPGAAPYHLCGYEGGARPVPEVLLYPTTAIVEDARVWLEEYIFTALSTADKRLVDQPYPEDLHVGIEVRLTADCKMQVNTTEPCNKCSGSGKWTNPRNATDKRDCFGCKGTGQHVTGKAKDAKGKVVYERLTAGIHGTVVDLKSFGQFYANGYNKPSRFNTTVQFCVDGRTVRASLEKLRLHREYQEPERLREKARALSFNYQFSAASGLKFAWDTRNYAAQIGRKP